MHRHFASASRASSPPPPLLGSIPFELRNGPLVLEILRHVRRLRPALSLVHQTTVCEAMVTSGPCADDELVITCAAPAALRRGASCLVRFWLHEAAFLVRARLVPLDGARFRLSGPLRMYSLDQRVASRVPLAPQRATLRWRTLSDGGLRPGSSPVTELSADGVGLEGDLGAVPRAGLFAAQLEIDGEEFPCLAEARHGSDAGAIARLGIRLDARGARARLLERYLRCRFPRLFRRCDVPPERVLELLERSGYMALRDGVTADLAWFSRRDDHAISRDVCYMGDDGRLVGHVSFTRAYPRAWLGHQLATVRDHVDALDCRRDIYLHIVAYPLLVDGNDAMMVGYYNREKRWHQRFFSSFIEWLDDPRLAVACEVDRFERSTDEIPAPVFAEGAEVGPARPDELLSATALVRAQMPELLSDVFDYHPERLENAVLHPGYVGTRYERGRSLLVLRQHGQLVGAALCETGSRELSIFNLFNMAQIFVATGAAAPSVAAQRQLLGAVRAFYRARGELHPLVVAPVGSFAAAEEPGTYHAERMGVIAWTGRGLRQYENFIKFHFGSLAESPTAAHPA